MVDHDGSKADRDDHWYMQLHQVHSAPPLNPSVSLDTSVHSPWSMLVFAESRGFRYLYTVTGDSCSVVHRVSKHRVWYILSRVPPTRGRAVPASNLSDSK